MASFLSVFSQPQGKLIIQNFSLLDIGSSSGSFWSVAEDRNGILYFGGEHAVYVYDGTNWRKIDLANKSVVRSLAINDEGVVFVGGVNEFGYLKPNNSGMLVYCSLLDKLPDDIISFPDIWSINIIEDTVYFQSANHIFKYWKDQIRVIRIQESYHRSFVINDKLIANQAGIGLSVLDNNSFSLMPGGEFFRDMVISSINYYNGGKLMIGTRRNGIFIYDPEAKKSDNIIPFNSEANNFLKDYQLYHGIELPGNRYAYATLRNGTIIADSQGKIQTYINKFSGSSDYTSYFLYLSNDSELWITSSRGISLYNINSALSYWNEEMGLFGSTNCILEHRNRIYAGTYSGLFFIDLNKSENNGQGYQPELFTHSENPSSEVWDFMLFNPYNNGNSENNELLAATGQGLYNVDREKLEFETGRVGQLSMYHSKINPTIIYLNAHPTFYILQYHNGEWLPVWQREISSYIISIVEDVDGNVWLGTMYYGIFKIGLEEIFRNKVNRESSLISGSEFSNISIENFNTTDGLPGLTMAKTLMYKNQLIILCEGIYTYDSKSNRIVKARNFGENVENWNRPLQDFKEDKFGNIWGYNNEILDKQTDGHFQIVRLPYEMLTIRNAAISYFHDNNGSTWIGGEHALLRYDHKIPASNGKKEFITLIRKVSINVDSIIFGGASLDVENENSYISRTQQSSRIPSIKYKSRSILFEYSSPYFNNDIPPEYSYFLEGYDEKWSEWTSGTFKEYNNLREKDYTFRVKARNYSGDISQEADYSFTIVPPWQRTILAYLIFIISIITIILLGIKAYVNQLRKSNIHLEQLVKERTSLLEMQKEEINKQAGKLKIQNEKLLHQRNRMSEMSKEILRTNRDKLRFFTNISHELRTPLTLILGPIEELINDDQSLTKEQSRNKFNIISKNAKRLLALVNQILDFRKLEITRPKLAASEGDIVAFVKDLTVCFKELANKKDIKLVFVSEMESLMTWYDADKIGKILFNLISNAFKYTDEGGKIKVEVSITSDRYSGEGEKKVISISVSDTGIGIDEELLPRIFDRFYHSGNPVTFEQAGSGIGLSMAATLAEIHCGKIEVESEVGKGSEFTLIIPHGEAYLKDSEKEPTADQNVLQSIGVKARMEVINHLNVSSREISNEISRDSGKELILIVEDSEDIRSYIIDGLGKNFDFIEAENGEQGLDLAMKFNPDLIVSDILMPKMDGYKFCSLIKATIEISHIPVILLTSKSEDEDQLHGLEVGADDYIAKPFNIKILEARIKNIISSRKRLKEKFSKDLIYKPADIVITSTDEKFLNKALKTVENNISNHEFDVDLFAREMAMSQSTLYRKLKSLTGESTNNFIKEFRLKQAAKILQNNEVQVSEVALMVGFDDPAYFAKSFKQKFGKSPSEYTKVHK